MEDEDEICGVETLWRGIGNFLSRYEQYEKSLKYYDLAVATTPLDTKTLIDRARARARCNNYKGALRDIKAALDINDQDLVVLAEKAHTTFLNTEFEEALIQNHRLLPKRRKPDHFFLGVLKCISTIDQCLGDIAGKPLRDHFLIIRKLAWKWNIKSIKEKDFYPKGKEKKKEVKEPKKEKKKQSLFAGDEATRICDRLQDHKEDTFTIPPFITEVKFAPLQRYTKNIEKYMAERYLDRMYREKEFVRTIVDHPGIFAPNKVSTRRLKELANDCYTAVSKKQEVLRTSRPFYFLKYQEAKITGNLRSRQEMDLLLHQQNYRKEAEKILQKMENAFSEKRLPEILDFSEKFITFCKSKSKRVLPDKDEYMQRMLVYIRRGFYDLYRLNREQLKWDQDKRVMVCLDQPISREPSRDSVINQFQFGFVDFQKEIDIFQERRDKAESQDEVCWCYHEMARYNMLAGNYVVTRGLARKCLLDITDNESMEEWYVNLTMLLVRTYMKEKDKIDALTEARTALQIAEKRKDRILREYLKRMISLIHDIEFDDITGAKLTDKRQKKILALLGNDKLKEEFESLFRTMAAMPSSRRFSILPDAYKPKTDSEGSPRASSRISKMSKLGESEASEGAEFMQLIKFQL